jgi:hypothetical protein
MPDIFISYRRDDTSGYAGRLYDQISAHFGKDHVFMDVADIEPGSDFVQVLEEKVGSCDALLALIGKNWLTSIDDQGRPRLSNPEDFVSAEIAAALKRNVEVIPVLVGGAKMPSQPELPQQLQFFSRHQAIELTDARFSRDVQDLIAALQRPAGKRKPGLPKWTGIAVACLVAALGLGVWFWHASRRDGGRKDAQVATHDSAPQTGPSSPATSFGGTGNTNISGNWKAVFQKPDATYEVYFTFDVMGNKLFGRVIYPTGEAGILDGVINQGRFSFTTKHMPQFAEEKATITVEGQVSGDEIQVVTQGKDGYAKGVAHRVTQVGTLKVLTREAR